MVGLDMLVISLVSKDSKIHQAVTDVFVTQGGLVSTVTWSVPSMERYELYYLPGLLSFPYEI